jgi:hypothetical protein
VIESVIITSENYTCYYLTLWRVYIYTRLFVTEKNNKIICTQQLRERKKNVHARETTTKITLSFEFLRFYTQKVFNLSQIHCHKIKRDDKFSLLHQLGLVSLLSFCWRWPYISREWATRWDNWWRFPSKNQPGRRAECTFYVNYSSLRASSA